MPEPGSVRAMRDIPAALMCGPFSRATATQLGVSKSMFAGQRFVRLHPRVWRHRDHVMTWSDEVAAARLALPEAARPTHLTRIQMLGLDQGPRRPLHFVMQSDLHLALHGIFLHRTVELAPCDEYGVVPAAAYLACCVDARVIDAMAVGDWLIHQGHMTVDELVDLALSAPWRDGADEALWVADLLDGRSRSIKESELRAVLVASGLPTPQPNHPVALGGDAVAIGDLVFRPWGLVVEYEGSHHQVDRRQYNADIERFALFRDHDVPYLQVTNESLARPQTLVGTVYRRLLRLGYVGPAPQFGEAWTTLFRPIRRALPPRRTRLRGLASRRR
jgi:hypothetical protein